MRIAKKVLRTGALVALVLPGFMARAGELPHCNGGVQLRLSAPQASQGSLVLAEVRSQKALKEITGTWADRTLYFWKLKPPTASRRGAGGDIREALLGVDLEKAPGSYPITVEVTLENEEQEKCVASLEVRAGKFATERLTVEKQFVEPNEQQAQRAIAEQQKLRTLFDHVTPQKLWNGSFRLPLDGQIKGSNFGRRRVLNGQPRSPHTGADFPAPTGTAVHATQSGRVALAEELYFSGNTVIIDHGLGVYSLYGHLSAFDAAEGDEVKSGQVIGKVGATGRVTGPHLHWGLTVNKARANPVLLVSVFRGLGAKN